MERAERQKLTLERIDPVLKAKGYKTRKADVMWYYLPQDGITVTWSLSFLKKYSSLYKYWDVWLFKDHHSGVLSI
ncbi:hypothetical protein [Porphyromonas sp.]